MQVTFIPSNEINSDLGVVNAARVSLNKKSNWIVERREVNPPFPSNPLNTKGVVLETKLSDADKKLINYLAQHNHWTPFAHSRLYFEIRWINVESQLHFLKNANLAGMTLNHSYNTSLIKGSLYSWINNAKWFYRYTRDLIADTITQFYPETAEAFNIEGYPTFTFNAYCEHLSEDYILEVMSTDSKWLVGTATLLVKVPIFVARQIRTSQVGIAYSDLYVEGESFIFNEVSRRYVDDNPEFYKVEEWRVREGGSIKQGSTGVLNETQNNERKIVQNIEQSRALATYEYDTQANIAPEQARIDLPQSMYTEFYMTATLHRWAQFLQLRLKPDVQQETRQVASLIASALSEQYPAWATHYEISY